MLNHNIQRLFIACLCLFMLSGCAVSNKFGPYIGQVLDAETKEPIEGAVVFMSCSTATPNPGGITSHYADFKEVLTDKKGEFHLELRVTTFKPGHLWKTEPTVYIFKPGYGVFPRHRGTTSDILVKGTSHVLPEDIYVTITLPELKTKKERRLNLRHLNVPSILETPLARWENLLRLENMEHEALGMKIRYSQQ